MTNNDKPLQSCLCYIHISTDAHLDILFLLQRGPVDNSRAFVMQKKTNPRYQNGTLRRKYRARFKAMDAPCGICKGKYGPIHYDEPSDSRHPLSFVIDEIIPVSRYRLGGYSTARECAEDWSNLRAAHYACNAQRGNKLPCDKNKNIRPLNIPDGDW